MCYNVMFLCEGLWIVSWYTSCNEMDWRVLLVWCLTCLCWNPCAVNSSEMFPHLLQESIHGGYSVNVFNAQFLCLTVCIFRSLLFNDLLNGPGVVCICVNDTHTDHLFFILISCFPLSYYAFLTQLAWQQFFYLWHILFVWFYNAVQLWSIWNNT